MTGLKIDLREYETKEISLDTKSKMLLSNGKFVDVLPLGNDSFKVTAKNYVGIIPITNDDFVYVLPKVGIDNVLQMFKYVYEGFHQLTGIPAVSRSNDFLTLLVRIFTGETSDLVTKHYRRFYQPTIENTSTPRGKLLTVETLRRNRLTVPRAYVEFNTFTPDILDNQIVKYTLFLLLGAASQMGMADQRQLRMLYSYFDEVSLSRISRDDFAKCQYDRLNAPYERVHRLCRLFVEHSYVTHMPGDYDLFCYAFDMNSLYEEFVREVLRVHLGRAGLGVIGSESGYLDVSRLIKIRPDVMIYDAEKLLLVLDCKYKKTQILKDDAAPSTALPMNSDVYQLLSYMVARRCQRGVLVYPKTEGEDVELAVVVNGERYLLYVRTIDLSTITESSLEEFASRIKKVMMT